MVNIELKDCCMDCGNVDIECSEFESVKFGTTAIIKCAHSEVCAKYNEVPVQS